MPPKKKRTIPDWMKYPADSASSGQSVTSSSTPALTVKQSPSTDKQVKDYHSNEEESDTPQYGTVRNLKVTPESSKEKHLINGESSNNLSQDDSLRSNDLSSSDEEDKHEKGRPSALSGGSVTPDSTSGTSSINNPVVVVNGTTSPTPNNTTRKSCYYGSSCYRKNPQHRTDFAHPGDPDFSNSAGSSSTTPNTGASPSNDIRPLCEFGMACYRKNPQHRKDFRHDAPQKRQARPTDLQDIPSDNDGDFDASFSSDNYNPGNSESDDSFITSDSMGSEDSDFNPEDDEENEKKAKKRRKTNRDRSNKEKKGKKAKQD